MRKQARRLWFGDWNRDQEQDQADTVVIVPEDDPDPAPAEERRGVSRGVLAGVLAIALLFVLGVALSSGGNDNRLTSEQSQFPPAQAPQTQVPQAQPQVPQGNQLPQGGPQQGFGGPDLTGAGAQKAAEAALAQFPGDVERVTAGPTGGGYVVHVIQPDGNEVHVLVNDQFKVEGSDANSGPPSLGPGTSQ